MGPDTPAAFTELTAGRSRPARGAEGGGRKWRLTSRLGERYKPRMSFSSQSEARPWLFLLVAAASIAHRKSLHPAQAGSSRLWEDHFAVKVCANFSILKYGDGVFYKQR